jgi:ATP-dependent helicase Lhr and Lhr-like helicase
VLAALWDLVWAGYAAGDTLAPIRALLVGTGAHRARAKPQRLHYRRPGRAAAALATRTGPPTGAGRWYRLPERDLDPTRRAAALAEALLDRHGVVTRGAVLAEGAPGGFAGVYPVLSALEERGGVRRGYFVEGLGAAQFAVPGAVDRLRSPASDSGAVVLAATDPANPYGAALPWPDRVVDTGESPLLGRRPGTGPGTAAMHWSSDGEKAGHRASDQSGSAASGATRRPGPVGRKAGALVVVVDGELALYVERGGRTLLSYVDGREVLGLAAKALANAVHAGALGALSVERADGASVHASPLGDALAAAGFRATPRGLRLRG